MIEANADLVTLLNGERKRLSPDASHAFPGEQSFTSTTERWNLYATLTYSASISAATESDVVEAVRQASSQSPIQN
jgi:hypothetical protein